MRRQRRRRHTRLSGNQIPFMQYPADIRLLQSGWDAVPVGVSRFNGSHSPCGLQPRRLAQLPRPCPAPAAAARHLRLLHALGAAPPALPAAAPLPASACTWHSSVRDLAFIFAFRHIFERSFAFFVCFFLPFLFRLFLPFFFLFSSKVRICTCRIDVRAAMK